MITGMGIACPLGSGVKHVWEKLLAGESGITNLPKTDDYKYIPCKVAGMIPTGSEKGQLNIDDFVSPAEARTMSDEAAYSIAVTGEALKDANWWPHLQSERDRYGTGVNIANIGYGGFIKMVLANYDHLRTGAIRKISPYLIPKSLPNMASGNVSIRYKLQGPNLCVGSACAAASHAIGDSANLVSRGVVDVMVTGGIELLLDPLLIAGFCRAKALCTKFNDEPTKASRPFDSKRAGFVPSDGAAVLVLEELEHAKERGAQIYAEMLGFGMAGDAHHVTSPPDDGNGAQRAMMAAMKQAGIQLEDVSHISAHSTSTPVGDRIENYAIKQVFKEHAYNLLVYSAKGSLGHTQAAAGAVESVIAAMCVCEGYVPPNLNLEEKEPDFDLNYPTGEPTKWTVGEGKRRILLNNSFGFGGTNSSLCIGEFVP